MAAASASAASCRSRSAASVAVRRSAKLNANGTARAAIASSDSTTSTTRTRRPMSGVQPEAESAHRLQWKTDELRPDLPDEEVQRSGPADDRRAPHFEHQLLAADRLALAGGQCGKKLELGSGERLRLSLQGYFSALPVDA